MAQKLKQLKFFLYAQNNKHIPKEERKQLQDKIVNNFDHYKTCWYQMRNMYKDRMFDILNENYKSSLQSLKAHYDYKIERRARKQAKIKKREDDIINPKHIIKLKKPNLSKKQIEDEKDLIESIQRSLKRLKKTENINKIRW